MATDTTELTFIRCPECRSLVPAMSSRCRMCGATLNAKEAKSDEPTPPPSTATTSRVRQQTVSSSSSEELTKQLSEIRQESEVQDNKLIDPLEEFLSEESDDDIDENIDDHQELVAKEEAPQEIAEDADDSDDSEDDDLIDSEDDDFEDDLDELDDIYDEFDDLDDDVAEDVKAEPVVDAQSIQSAKEKVEEQKPKTRVVVEQGKGKFSKGLSFGTSKPRFDVKSEPPVVPPSVPPVIPAVVEKVKEEKVFIEEPKTDMQPKFKVDQEETKFTPPVLSSVSTKEAVKKGEQLGRIFGWLVSYTNPSGNSIELREGRFFVTSSQLRSTDLVLNDDTVSTPHAMFTIGTEGGIVIQDLKSERGVFIREQDQSTYRREYDNITLHHGDWVRFGDLEFLVSIIAHVGAK